MERTDKLTKLTSLILFLALLAYLGFSALHTALNPVTTALAMYTTVAETTTVSGIVVREEQYITATAENLNITAGEGSHVSAGAELAVSLESEAALERASREKELELEIARAEALLQGGDSTGNGDNSVHSSVLGLAGAVAARNMQDIESCSMSLSSLVLSGGETVTQTELNALKMELAGMENTASRGATRVTAPVSGTFSAALDGYEYLTADQVSGITADKLRELMQEQQEVPADAMGKIVSSYVWLYAAAVEEEAAAELEPGDRLQLDFGRYYGSLIEARVLEKGPAADGEQVVLFSCSAGLEDTVQMRVVSAEIVMEEYTGIRVPNEALYETEDETFVYTMTANQAEKKAVTVLYRGEEFCLVEKSPDTDALRAGNEIIVEAKDLYDGKMMD